jgi:hypothetical protein
MTTQGEKVETVFWIVLGDGELRLLVPVDVKIRRYLAGSFGVGWDCLTRVDQQVFAAVQTDRSRAEENVPSWSRRRSGRRGGRCWNFGGIFGV